MSSWTLLPWPTGPVQTLCAVLYYTGCRISEALALTPRRVDIGDQVVIVESLKKRRRGVYRAVPVPGIDRPARHGAWHQGGSQAKEKRYSGRTPLADCSQHGMAACHLCHAERWHLGRTAPLPEGATPFMRCQEAYRSTCCPSGWGIHRWRQRRSMPTP